MANENMEEYRTGPAIIDETVRVAKKYLEEHPEETGGSMEPVLNVVIFATLFSSRGNGWFHGTRK